MNKMKWFSNLSETARIMLLAVLGVCLFLLALGLIIIFLVYPFEKPLPFALGLACGCVLSELKVLLLEKSINRLLEMDSAQAQTYARLQAAARYGLTIVVFLAVILFPKVIGLFGTVAGIISLQPAAYIVNIVLKKHDGKAP